MGAFVRAVAIGIVAVSALLGPRIAAAQPAPVYSWTGFYLGGNVGYGFSGAPTNATGGGSLVDRLGFTNTFTFTDVDTTRLAGVVGGGQFGFNYQFASRWVTGLEADLQGSGLQISNTFADPILTQQCVLGLIQPGKPLQCGKSFPVNGTAMTAYQSKIAWFDTVRVRLGYLVTDQVLIYGTGGLAYGRVELSAASTATATTPTSFGPTDTLAAIGAASGTSKTNTGFVVGGGVEARFWPSLPANWSWKLEYLYVDLGSLDATTSFAGAFQLSGIPLSGTVALHTHLTDNIVRVGINYSFAN